MDYYSFIDMKGRKVELAWLADPQQILYQRSSHMPTVDQV